MHTKELAQDVQDGVQQDFPKHYRVTDTEAFLNRLFPVPQTTLDTIFQSVKDSNFYNPQTKRWRGFPDHAQQKGEPKAKRKKAKENSMYAPFCAITEAIRGCAEKQRSSVSAMGAMQWVDYHSKSPLSQNTQAAQLRPDSLLAFRAIASKEGGREGAAQEGAEEESKVGTEGVEGELEEEVEVDGTPEEVEDEEQAEPQNKEKENVIVQQSIWWLQVIAAVEMKRTDSQNWADVVKQLFGYLRRILREQLDRRFVFGLTLGPDMMTVWLHDRSGVIGTKTAINIHKEPVKLIQVIASFSLLPPEMLGFDPTIEMLVSSTQAVPSYNPNEDFIRAYRAVPHNRQWVIRMNDGTKYVTVETVSSVRAGFMRGRGGIAWVVAPFDKAREKSKVFVLKQSWRPREVASERDLYGKSECDYVGKIERCEEVLISSEEDATDTLIRKGLDASQGLKRLRNHWEESVDPSIHVTCTAIGDIKEVIARETGPPVSRVRTRVLLSTYGWLIKYFSTRRELLVVLRDAIRGHKYLYQRGVLHRDISPGNILVKWQPGCEADEPSTSGCLIDLDHAKKGKLAQDEVNPPANDKIDHIRNMLQVITGIEVDNEVARLALEFFPMRNDNLKLMTYLEAAHTHASNFRPLNGQLCTPQHLRWEQVKMLHNFDFHPTERQKASRIGTPPYTSGEILSGGRYFNHEDNVFHDAVHDLESFFWVLVHICITRQGPGSIRREELEQKNHANEEYNGLRRVVHCFFDSIDGRMAANKREIFTHPHEFEEYVLGNFHGYFHPLRGLVEEWFHLLILAHKFHAFEYHNIHDMVLEILDRALESAPLEDIKEAAQNVLNDRKANIEKLSDDNSFGKVQQSQAPPPRTSPTSQGCQGKVAQPVYHSPPSSPTPVAKRGKTRDDRE